MTSRAARFSSGLSLYDFLKRTSFVKCDAASFAALERFAMLAVGTVQSPKRSPAGAEYTITKLCLSFVNVVAAIGASAVLNCS